MGGLISPIVNGHGKSFFSPPQSPASEARNQDVVTPIPLASFRSKQLKKRHPVEVVGRFKPLPLREPKSLGNLNTGVKTGGTEVSQKGCIDLANESGLVALRFDGKERNFQLDAISLASNEGLDGFYKTYIHPKVENVKMGSTCTILMYGPTGSGKSFTMFGSGKEEGVAVKALKQLAGEDVLTSAQKTLPDSPGSSPALKVTDKVVPNGTSKDTGRGSGIGLSRFSPDRRPKQGFGKASILGGLGPGIPTGQDRKNTSVSLERNLVTVKVVEVEGEKMFDLVAKPGPTPFFKKGGADKKVSTDVSKPWATLEGRDPLQLLAAMVQVVQRRKTQATQRNSSSSRSHCLIFIELPDVAGSLVLVDMAGSENIQEAGTGNSAEGRQQTKNINLGNEALKRVIDALASGSDFIPYRQSKFTQLLQGSFAGQAKVLMVLCASLDPADIHKTYSTLEYGAKAYSIKGLLPQAARKLATDPHKLECQLRAKERAIEQLQAERFEVVADYEKRVEERDKEIAESRKEIAMLREKLLMAEKGQQVAALFKAEIERSSARTGRDRTKEPAQQLHSQVAVNGVKSVHARKVGVCSPGSQAAGEAVLAERALNVVENSPARGGGVTGDGKEAKVKRTSGRENVAEPAKGRAGSGRDKTAASRTSTGERAAGATANGKGAAGRKAAVAEEGRGIGKAEHGDGSSKAKQGDSQARSRGASGSSAASVAAVPIVGDWTAGRLPPIAEVSESRECSSSSTSIGCENDSALRRCNDDDRDGSPQLGQGSSRVLEKSSGGTRRNSAAAEDLGRPEVSGTREGRTPHLPETTGAGAKAGGQLAASGTNYSLAGVAQRTGGMEAATRDEVWDGHGANGWQRSDGDLATHRQAGGSPAEEQAAEAASGTGRFHMDESHLHDSCPPASPAWDEPIFSESPLRGEGHFGIPRAPHTKPRRPIPVPGLSPDMVSHHFGPIHQPSQYVDEEFQAPRAESAGQTGGALEAPAGQVRNAQSTDWTPTKLNQISPEPGNLGSASKNVPKPSSNLRLSPGNLAKGSPITPRPSALASPAGDSVLTPQPLPNLLAMPDSALPKVNLTPTPNSRPRPVAHPGPLPQLIQAPMHQPRTPLSSTPKNQASSLDPSAAAVARRVRIANIFQLCGEGRQVMRSPAPQQPSPRLAARRSADAGSPRSSGSIFPWSFSPVRKSLTPKHSPLQLGSAAGIQDETGGPGRGKNSLRKSRSLRSSLTRALSLSPPAAVSQQRGPGGTTSREPSAEVLNLFSALGMAAPVLTVPGTPSPGPKPPTDSPLWKLPSPPALPTPQGERPQGGVSSPLKVVASLGGRSPPMVTPSGPTGPVSTNAPLTLTPASSPPELLPSRSPVPLPIPLPLPPSTSPATGSSSLLPAASPTPLPIPSRLMSPSSTSASPISLPGPTPPQVSVSPLPTPILSTTPPLPTPPRSLPFTAARASPSPSPSPGGSTATLSPTPPRTLPFLVPHAMNSSAGGKGQLLGASQVSGVASSVGDNSVAPEGQLRGVGAAGLLSSSLLSTSDGPMEGERHTNRGMGLSQRTGQGPMAIHSHRYLSRQSNDSSGSGLWPGDATDLPPPPALEVFVRWEEKGIVKSLTVARETTLAELREAIVEDHRVLPNFTFLWAGDDVDKSSETELRLRSLNPYDGNPNQRLVRLKGPPTRTLFPSREAQKQRVMSQKANLVSLKASRNASQINGSRISIQAHRLQSGNRLGDQASVQFWEQKLQINQPQQVQR